MAVKRNYRINLRNYGNPPAVMVSQYDENYSLTFEVYDGPLPASGLNTYTVKLVGTRADTLKYSFDGTVTGVANNVLNFTIDTTMTACAGKGVAEIVILDATNDVKFASFNLPVYVEKAAVPDDAVDADVERAQEIAEQVEELIDGATEGAEAWAVGQRGGVDVESTDPTYHNNSKYYAEQAQDIADSIGIDATLSISGKAADAKKTGDEISELKEDLNVFRPTATSADVGKALIVKTVADGVPTAFEYGETGDANAVPFPESPESKYGTSGQVLETLGDGTTRWKSVDAVDPSVIENAVTDWLDEHPEATTTVQDWSLTANKMVKGELGFVTPEMFGAVGDGETDDSDAINAAVQFCIQQGAALRFMRKTYGVLPKLDYKVISRYWHMKIAILIDGAVDIDLNGATIQLLTNTESQVYIIEVVNVKKGSLRNGTIIGDIDTYTATGSQWDSSKNINLYEASNYIIENIISKDGKGDCLGIGGVQITQDLNIPFIDYEMNIAVRNCIFSHGNRCGCTMDKYRGVTFENCVFEKSTGFSPAAGLDIEPYFGYGSGFNCTFINCTFKENGGGAFVQHVNDTKFIGCNIQSVMIRNADDVVLDGCNIGSVLFKTAGAKVYGCTIGDQNAVNYQAVGFQPTVSHLPTVPSVDIFSCKIFGIFSYVGYSNDLHDHILIKGCEILAKTGNKVVFGFDNTAKMHVNGISIIGNVVKVIKTGLVSYEAIFREKYDVIEIKDNTFIVDANDARAGVAIVGTFYDAEKLVFTGNNLDIERKQDSTYTNLWRALFAIKNTSLKHIVIANNVINPSNIVLTTNNNYNVYAVLKYDNTGNAVDVIAYNNYMYGLAGLTPSSDLAVNFLYEKDNVLSNTSSQNT